MLQATASQVTSLSVADCLQGAAPGRREGSFPVSTRPRPPSAGRTVQLLVIGEELGLTVQQWRDAFAGPSHQLAFAKTAAVGVDHVRRHSPDLILLDLRLLDQPGLEVLQQIRRINAPAPVICVTRDRCAGAVIEATMRGAYDCLLQPLRLPELRRVVHEALEIGRQTRQPFTTEGVVHGPDPECGIVGFCPAMGEVYKAIGRVAAQNVPVLITGESGTGKELVARAIYEHSGRAKGPFLALNCAAIPENLLESELFGHEKGAFTGADRRRIGKFEQCSGGTLLLDEIGDMPLSLQAKVLRLLQEQSFERVGGNETVRTEVRLIAATHRDLKACCSEGKFRADLYYRLGVFTIPLPALRERGDDLPLLVRHYVRRFSRELGREVRHVAPEAMDRLRGYGWPGNIRELQSVLKQALLQASGPALLLAFLPELPAGPNTAATSPAGDGLDLVAFIDRRQGPDASDLYAETHAYVDRFLLRRVLDYTDGNQHQAAQLLGIARQTLRVKLRDLGLHVTRSVQADEDSQPSRRKRGHWGPGR